MTTKKVRKLNPHKLPLLDARLRYSLDETAAYLRTSRPTICDLIAKEKLLCIREGKRKFVPGTEILRRSALG
jgi:hypothetical protein